MEQKGTAAFFKNARVGSCQHVEVKNGQPRAISYPAQRVTSRSPQAISPPKTEFKSHAAQTYQRFQSIHAGMKKKPLAPYSANSFRSRMQTADFIIPYKNTSQFEIGDRTAPMGHHYKSTYKRNMRRPDVTDMTSHPAILSERCKWVRGRLMDQ